MEECKIKVGDHVRRTSSQWSSVLCSCYPGNESLDTVYEVLETRYNNGYYAVRGKNIDTGIEYGLTDFNLIIVKSSSYSEDIKQQTEKQIEIPLDLNVNNKHLFVPGAKVKVRSLDWYETFKNSSGHVDNGCCDKFSKNMKYLCGKTFTIDRTAGDILILKEEGCRWFAFMFEDITKPYKDKVKSNKVHDGLFISYEKSLELTEDKEDYSMFVRKNKIKLINPKTENYE